MLNGTKIPSFFPLFFLTFHWYRLMKRVLIFTWGHVWAVNVNEISWQRGDFRIREESKKLHGNQLRYFTQYFSEQLSGAESWDKYSPGCFLPTGVRTVSKANPAVAAPTPTHAVGVLSLNTECLPGTCSLLYCSVSDRENLPDGRISYVCLGNFRFHSAQKVSVWNVKKSPGLALWN